MALSALSCDEEPAGVSTPVERISLDSGTPQSSDAGQNAAPVIRLQGAVKWRRSQGGGFALVIESLVLARHGLTAVIGPSGCGKSTLLDLLAITVRPDVAEDFTFNAARSAPFDVRAAWRARGDDADLAALRRRHIGYVLQTGGLLPFLTVRDNIMLTLRSNGAADPRRVEELAERLGIDGQLKRHPRDLSIGQRQRVAIARAVAHRPELVVADEPTSALDPENARLVIRLLLDEAKNAGAALVVATHDPELLAGEAQSTVRFEPGEREGCPASLVRQESA
jgi:putative ABC transport system ATP-binding protein